MDGCTVFMGCVLIIIATEVIANGLEIFNKVCREAFERAREELDKKHFP
jgi:hypothetical protein